MLALVMEAVEAARNMLNYANWDWADNFPALCYQYRCDNVNRALEAADMVLVRSGSDFCRYFSTTCNSNRFRRTHRSDRMCTVSAVAVD